MKKKILLAFIIVSLLVCLFAISVSATEPDSEYLESMTSGMLTVTLEDGTIVDLYDDQGKALTYYRDPTDSSLKSVRVEDLVYRFSGSKLYRIELEDGTMLAGDAQKGIAVVVNLRGVKNSSGEEITNFNSDNMFKENSPLQHIFMPDTIVHMQSYAFGFRTASNSHLIGCYFSENSQLQTISTYMFWNCKNLRYFNMPKGVTSIGNCAFYGCESIGEMYIPSGVTSLGYDGSNQGCFGNNKNMYFVNTPGEPKPKIYYLPENVAEIKGELFKNCTNLNDVIVFNENITSINSDCAFYKTNAVTLVFLGDVQGLNTQSYTQWQTLKAIYFCNENDVDANSFTTIQPNIASKFVFCNSNKVYNPVKQSNNTYVLTLSESDADHLAEKSVNVPASCEVDAGLVTYCFCGHEISKEAVEGTALGHNHTIFVGLTYTNYLENGCYSYKCERCDDVNNDKSAPALFICSGYSAPEEGAGGITVDYRANLDAIAEYERITGETISYGLYVATQNTLGNKYVFDENGVAIDGAVTIALSRKYTKMTVKLFGFETDELKATKFAVGAYVEAISTEGEEISYLQSGKVADGDKYAFVSYNDVVNNS